MEQTCPKKGRSVLPKITLTKRKTIGVRMPANPIAKMISQMCENPFLSCGIKLTEDEVLNDPYEINRVLGHCLDFIIDGGEVPFSPSSIISLVDEIPEIIREGSGDISFFKEK